MLFLEWLCPLKIKCDITLEAVNCGGWLTVERDTGFVTEENVMLNHLKLMLSGDYVGDSDFDSDDDSDEDDLSLLACMM